MAKKQAPRVLVVDDEPSVGMIFHRILGEAGYEVISASNGAECLRAIRREPPQMVFLDIQMPGMDGVETLRRIRQADRDLPVVIMTAFQTVDSAVSTMKLGALDYLIKPLNAERLIDIVHQALEISAVARRVPAVTPVGEPLPPVPEGEVVAHSPAMRRVLGLCEKVAPTDMTVLILGESGTGKEVMARAIHRASPRADKPIVTVDCAALPESLIESELFGVERGAFTGADSARAGKFEQANGGTLFLDEVGNLPLPIQVKLLRFLQDPVIERLGSRKGPLRLNVRMLAATNSRLEEAVRAGTFREDLYHRLNVFVIDLPPLRERGPEDLDALARGVVERFRKQLGRAQITLAPETMALLKSYRWPGNVRELQNALRSATLLAEDVVLPEHLPISIQNARPAMEAEAFTAGLSDVLRKVEKEHLDTVLKRHGGKHDPAARELGLDIGAFRDKLKELGL